jgi:site-specific recombinase XerD
VSVRKLIEPFFSWKRQQNGLKPATRRKYEPHLLAFAAWSGSRQVAAVSSQLVEFEFLPQWLAEFVDRHGRQPSPNTVRLLHNALSSFFDYCLRRGIIPSNPMLGIARPSYEPPMNDWLNYDEDLAMATVRMTPLEEIVCGLARLAGLRVEEIAAALIGHADRREGVLYAFGTKSAAAARPVVIFPELDAKLERWLAFQAAAGFSDDRCLLVSARDGSAVHPQYIWRIVKRVAARAGVRLHGRDDRGRPVALDDTGENVSEVSPHTLRRTFGSDLLNRGVRIEVVSQQLGHADTRITERAYAKLLPATQRREILRVGSGYPFFTRDQLRRRSR